LLTLASVQEVQRFACYRLPRGIPQGL